MRTSAYNLSLATLCILMIGCTGNPEIEPMEGPMVEESPGLLEWDALESPTKNHLRGLFAVNDSVVWISGTGGSVFRTSNGGLYWDNLSLPGCDTLDFRDIHAFDEENAFVMSSGYGVVIYGTTDGGIVWNELYRDDRPGAFFDGFDFWNKSEGIAYGDPIDGKLSLLKLRQGWIWDDIHEHLPKALEGEAGYAASGTGIVIRDNNVWIATGGGESSRVLHSADSGLTWTTHITPLISDPGKGIFSIAFRNENEGIAVGGSYIDSLSTEGNSAYTIDGGITWMVPDTVPRGYRSCVAFIDSGSKAITVGRSGCEYSSDGGQTWIPFSDEGYFVCDFGGNIAYAAGRGGKLAKMAITD